MVQGSTTPQRAGGGGGGGSGGGSSSGMYETVYKGLQAQILESALYVVLILSMY